MHFFANIPPSTVIKEPAGDDSDFCVVVIV